MGRRKAKFAERNALRAAYSHDSPVELCRAMGEMRDRAKAATTRFEQARIKAHKSAIRFHITANTRAMQLAMREG